MTQPVFIDLASALLIQQEQIEAFGGAHGLRDQTLLESALGQAQQTWANTNDMYEAAAQYALSIARNHPFVDGNKRTAAACMLVFMDINGMDINCTTDNIFTWTMKITVGEISREELAERLRPN